MTFDELAILALLLTGCGETLPAREPKPDATAHAAAPAAAEPARPKRFAASPITELANQVTEVAFAALEGKPAPSALPMGRPGTALVQREAGAPPAAELEVAAFATWVTLVLRDDERSLGDRDHALEDGGITVLLYLDASGLSLANLRLNRGGPAAPAPVWLAGLFTACDTLHRDAGAGKLAQWRLDARAREPQLAAVLAKARPTDDIVERAERVAEQRPLLGIWDVSFLLLARARDGSMWQLELVVEDLTELLAAPLVSLSRLKTE